MPLRLLANLALSGEVLGAWVRGCHRAVRLQCARLGPVRCRLLAAHDLGFLLRRCGRIVVCARGDIVVLPAEGLIAWRTLQIVVGTPYLPDLQQLRALYPHLRVSGRRIAVNIGRDSGQTALAACAAGRIPVVSTWIDYSDWSSCTE